MYTHNRFRARLQLEALEDRTAPAVFSPLDAAQLLADVATSRTNAEADIINLIAGGTYSLTESLVFADDGSTSLIGNGATLTRASEPETPRFGIIRVNSSAALSVAGVTITNGAANGADGGGISVGTSAQLTVANSTISGNFTIFRFGPLAGGDGGGIFIDSFARVTVANSTISKNWASDTGGGISLHGERASVTVANSTISGNFAIEGGGGITLQGSNHSVTVANSTISGNSAGGSGGGLALDTSSTAAVIRNSTVAFNASDNGKGGGIFVNIGALATLQSTIVSNNLIGLTGSFADIAGSVMAGNCLIEDTFGTTLAFGSVGNVTGKDPLLEPLADNGGPTQTHALHAGSAAIDSGVNPQGLEDDQRGEGFARVLGAGVDIGAFEATPPAGSVDFGATAFSGSEGGGPLTVTLVRSGGTAGSLSVDLNPSGGSADFVGAPATVTFADGQTTASVSLAIVDDALVEGPESFTLSLSGSLVGTPETATLQIADNDSAPLLPPPTPTPVIVVNQLANVTAQVAVRTLGVRFDARTGTTTLLLRLHNRGATTLTGPISFVVFGLPKSITLLSRTGSSALTAPKGVPFQNVWLGPANLVQVTSTGANVTSLGGPREFLPGDSATLKLVFKNRLNASFRFRWHILAGAGAR